MGFAVGKNRFGNAGGYGAISADAAKPSHSLIQGLVSWWTLNEAAGQALDAHGVNHLTEVGGPIASAPGKVGNARDLELSNGQYFSRPDNADLSVGDVDFTFCCWVKAESLATYNTIINKWGVSGTFEYKIYRDQSTTAFHFILSADGVGYTNWQGNVAPVVGTWYFIAAWHDSVANTINIQIDNAAVISAAYVTGVFNGPSVFQIGQGDPGQNWDGLIDEVGFWKRVLTPAERTFLYNGGAGRSYAELL